QTLALRGEGEQAEPPIRGIRSPLDQPAFLERVGQCVDIGRIVVEPSRQLTLGLRLCQLSHELALGEGKAALRHPGGEVVPKAGKGVVPKELPERLGRLGINFGCHVWNIPGRSMVYSCESFNDRDKHWRQRHGVCSLLDRSRDSQAN